MIDTTNRLREPPNDNNNSKTDDLIRNQIMFLNGVVMKWPFDTWTTGWVNASENNPGLRRECLVRKSALQLKEKLQESVVQVRRGVTAPAPSG